MKFANIALAQGQPCLQEGPHRVPWEEAGHEQGPHDQGGEESRQDREKAENSHWRLSGPGQKHLISTSSQEENILFSSLSEPCRRSYQAADGRWRAAWTNQAGVGDIQPVEGRFLCQGLMEIKIIILMVLWCVIAPFLRQSTIYISRFLSQQQSHGDWKLWLWMFVNNKRGRRACKRPSGELSLRFPDSSQISKLLNGWFSLLSHPSDATGACSAV